MTDDDKPTHPSRPAIAVGRVWIFSTEHSATGMSLDVNDEGMSRMLRAAMADLRDGQASTRIRIAWEKAVANGEIGAAP